MASGPLKGWLKGAGSEAEGVMGLDLEACPCGQGKGGQELCEQCSDPSNISVESFQGPRKITPAHCILFRSLLRVFIMKTTKGFESYIT